MDPNTTLATIRQAIHYDGDLPDRLEILTEHFCVLDNWLRTGGFLPDAWESQPQTTDHAGQEWANYVNAQSNPARHPQW